MSKRPYFHEPKPSENTEMTPHFRINSVISFFTRSTECYVNSSMQYLNHFCKLQTFHATCTRKYTVSMYGCNYARLSLYY